MREQVIRRWLFAVLVLVASPRAEAACVDASSLVRSTVSLVRIFGEGERKANSGVLGIAGTGWFLSLRSIVTAAHVAEAMHLSAQDWSEIEIRERGDKASIAVRILRLLGSHSEKIAVLELRTSFPDAAILQIRMAPLVVDEPVVSLAYPGRRLRFASGRFVRYGTDERFAGTALLEMHDGNDRLVIDHGASGAPVLDCEGRVVAIATNMLSQTITFQSQVVRLSTAWQTPNVVAVPISPLRDLVQAE